MKTASSLPDHLHTPESYTIADASDILRVDRLCRELLDRYRAELDAAGNRSVQDAAARFGGAAYFLRDFIIDHLQANLLRVGPRQVRGFAGNWYIVSTLEPNTRELEAILPGVADFYRFAAARNLLDKQTAEAIAAACREFDYYQQRIIAFHDLQGAGYQEWRQECPIDAP